MPSQETWQAMEKLIDEGLVKSIGISNFSVKKVEDLLKYARFTPAVNQVGTGMLLSLRNSCQAVSASC
jgi:diketogulonate reductase-like aldo/keto reductase